MNKSLPPSEAMELINNWTRDSLPIKLALFGRSPAATLLLRGKSWPLPDASGVALRLGVDGVFEFILSLKDADFELEDSAEAPDDLQEEAMGRHVRCITCTLPDIVICLYELWAADEQ